MLDDIKPYLVENYTDDPEDEIFLLAHSLKAAKEFMLGVVDTDKVRELALSQKIEITSLCGHGSVNLTAAFWCELFNASPGPVLLSIPRKD